MNIQVLRPWGSLLLYPQGSPSPAHSTSNRPSTGVVNDFVCDMH